MCTISPSSPLMKATVSDVPHEVPVSDRRHTDDGNGSNGLLLAVSKGIASPITTARAARTSCSSTSAGSSAARTRWCSGPPVDLHLPQGASPPSTESSSSPELDFGRRDTLRDTLTNRSTKHEGHVNATVYTLYTKASSSRASSTSSSLFASPAPRRTRGAPCTGTDQTPRAARGCACRAAPPRPSQASRGCS